MPVNVVSNHFSVVEEKIEQSEFDEVQFVSLVPKANNFYRLFIKRAMDLLIATVILVLLSPILFTVAILIKLTSNGPVFYVPTSIGKDGKPFRFYKFRSMYNAVSDHSHRRLIADFISGKKKDGKKLQNDPRVTPIGKLIRKYSLDEFPQLINVLKGEMSLVGPRPSTQYEYDLMGCWHKKRYSVLPGMTGLWQVNGRSEVSFADMVMMDIYYVENCSFWFDIVILLKTIRVVIFGKGGY
jgi:undecaprenyl-phosphate galactose phosphotransferase